MARGRENIFVPGFERADGRGDEIRANWVSPGYLTTMGIQLVAGRDFSPSDERGNQQVAIVTENLAHHYFPGQNPIGRRVGLQDSSKPGRPRLLAWYATSSPRESPATMRTWYTCPPHRRPFPTVALPLPFVQTGRPMIWPRPCAPNSMGSAWVSRL